MMPKRRNMSPVADSAFASSLESDATEDAFAGLEKDTMYGFCNKQYK
jgi:hypothetical protein